ncbi:MAG: hypothetical protein GX089_11345 [Fibrobacter sp.]|nr:hypothetical protein [Fibrobacter sp.]
MDSSLITFSLIAAIIFTAIYGFGFHSGPRSALVIFFSVIFSSVWAAGLWLRPVGPMFMGVFWLPLIAVALIFSVLLAFGIGGISYKSKDPQAVSPTPLVVFFWVLAVFLIVAIITGYLVR